MADSLWHVLHTSELTSKERIDIYRLLSDCYGSYDTYRTIACLKKGLEIAEREETIKYIPHFTRTLGVYYNMLMRYDTAKMYLDRSLACALRRSGDKFRWRWGRCACIPRRTTGAG